MIIKIRKPTPTEALAAAREAAINEAVAEAEAARLAALRAEIAPAFSAAKSLDEIEAIKAARKRPK